MPSGERYDVDRAEGRLRTVLGDDTFVRLVAEGRIADANDLITAVIALAPAA